MSEPIRPDPDDLLAAIRKDQSRSTSGRLRIFFGMAAGVGKTYAMLKAAQDRLTEGIDVVVGTVDTHARLETEALLTGLPIIPRKKIDYRRTAFEEMDIDVILARRPRLVLVDELAHTNIPGSRHPKRWHDVIELLDAGIDVYTTINVQHIESRKESVESITGVRIRETVPDSILERASQIVLIDITPAELLKRLTDGKVYLGDMAESAARNFFQEDRLTALREIALRLTAEKVDDELQGMITIRTSDAGWKSTERLMVAVSHSPFSEGLIRATRRLAYGLGAPWIGVYVDTGLVLSNQDRACLAKNLSLVRELGGEVLSTADTDIAQALDRIARQRDVTQLVVGRPTRRWFSDAFRGGTVLDRLVRSSSGYDVHVLRQDAKPPSKARRQYRVEGESAGMAYGSVLLATIVVMILSTLVLPVIGYRAVGFLFLLMILGLGSFVSIGPIMVAAVLSTLIWDYFFIPPYGTILISAPEDIAMCVAYLMTAVTTGTLTYRIRKRERMLRLREERTRALYEIVQLMAAGRDKTAIMTEVAGKLGAVVNGECSVVPSSADGRLERRTLPSRPWCTDDKEWAVAQWAFEHRQAAGWSTDTLPSAAGMYIPLKGTAETVGILAFHPDTAKRLLQEEDNLLATVARQLAMSMERELLQERARQAERLAESERLYQTILNSISHEIRTPLTAIIGSATALQDNGIIANVENRDKLLRELTGNAERLNRVVSNLLDMSRLSSGVLSLKRDWHDINDLIARAVGQHRDALANHTIVARVPQKFPFVYVDFGLFEQAISNLLINAAAYTPPSTTIEIEARADDNAITLTISDNGPGIPSDSLPHLFDKFYRVPGTPAGGTGIGLAITRAVIEAHEGAITVDNRPGGGAVFAIRLPNKQQPDVPDDSGGQ
ncbi:MAG: sensor histidine kinase KdpD [candidate division Zixibacteria bacterium]|nr:sensor histidine kinase KdpD [candidate division Zixibacteria bacterium]